MSLGVASALADFVETPLDAALAGADDALAAQTQAVDLFHSVARDVPAYRALLDKFEIDPDSIQTFEDFQRLPLINKANYHTQYELRELCRHGRLEANDFIAVSSGSTGQPTFWPRFVSDELSVSRRFEQAFYDSFRADERRRLRIELAPLGDPTYFPTGVKHRYTRR